MSDESKRPIRTRHLAYLEEEEEEEGNSTTGGAEDPQATGGKMTGANRRVPTAADVERCEKEDRFCFWWIALAGTGFPVWVNSDRAASPGVLMYNFVGSGEDDWDLVANVDPDDWLGPVNPEPLPRPESER